jgi:hypothetical protein
VVSTVKVVKSLKWSHSDIKPVSRPMKPGFTKVVLDWLYEVYISKLDSQKTGL